MTDRFVPTCKGCGGGACFGIGFERRDFARNEWWCGKCIPPALASWRPASRQGGASQDLPSAAVGLSSEAPREGRKQFSGGLF